jgi:hypothetical protein
MNPEYLLLAGKIVSRNKDTHRYQEPINSNSKDFADDIVQPTDWIQLKKSIRSCANSKRIYHEFYGKFYLNYNIKLIHYEYYKIYREFYRENLM